MDHLRKTLDHLMGKDRDLPLNERLSHQKHFDSPDVCKYFLLGFCPHGLFPNTKSDLKECKDRHDQQFKIMFENDPNKEQYQIKYEEKLMEYLEKLVAEVDKKMKKSMERIDAPIPEQEVNEETQEKINQIDNQISELTKQAEKYGEIGLVDDSEIVLKEIEKLKQQKEELITMNEHPLMFKEKQMKVCEVCGAMQSAQDNEKRLQTHIEGKLHSGYLKIRQELDILRKRKLERKRKMEEEKQKEKLEKEYFENERERESRERRERSDYYNSYKRERERSKDYRDYSREKLYRDRHYHYDRERDRDRERDYRRRTYDERHRSRSRKRSRSRDYSYRNGHSKGERSREYERDRHRERYSNIFN